MSMHGDPRPIQCIGGPHDGLPIDVTPETPEVQRPTAEGRYARYVVVFDRAYFAGYDAGPAAGKD